MKTSERETWRSSNQLHLKHLENVLYSEKYYSLSLGNSAIEVSTNLSAASLLHPCVDVRTAALQYQQNPSSFHKHFTSLIREFFLSVTLDSNWKTLIHMINVRHLLFSFWTLSQGHSMKGLYCEEKNPPPTSQSLTLQHNINPIQTASKLFFALNTVNVWLIRTERQQLTESFYFAPTTQKQSDPLTWYRNSYTRTCSPCHFLLKLCLFRWPRIN